MFSWVKINYASIVIYADFETLLEKVNGCENNSKKTFTMGVNKDAPCGFQFLKNMLIVMIKKKNILML